MSRVYDAFLATRGPCVLLESTAAPSPHARRSLLARNPRAALVVDQDGLRQANAEGVRRVAGDAFTAPRSMLRDVRPGQSTRAGSPARSPTTRRCGGSAPRRSPGTCEPGGSRSFPRRRSGC